MFVRGTIFIIVVLTIMMIISWQLTLAVFLGIIPLCIFAAFYMGWMRDLQKLIQKEKAVMNTVAEESFSNVRTVKAFSNEDEEMSKFDGGNTIVFGVGKQKAVL